MSNGPIKGVPLHMPVVTVQISLLAVYHYNSNSTLNKAKSLILPSTK